MAPWTRKIGRDPVGRQLKMKPVPCTPKSLLLFCQGPFDFTFTMYRWLCHLIVYRNFFIQNAQNEGLDTNENSVHQITISKISKFVNWISRFFWNLEIHSEISKISRISKDFNHYKYRFQFENLWNFFNKYGFQGIQRFQGFQRFHRLHSSNLKITRFQDFWIH